MNNRSSSGGSSTLRLSYKRKERGKKCCSIMKIRALVPVILRKCSNIITEIRSCQPFYIPLCNYPDFDSYTFVDQSFPKLLFFDIWNFFCFFSVSMMKAIFETTQKYRILVQPMGYLWCGEFFSGKGYDYPFYLPQQGISAWNSVLLFRSVENSLSFTRCVMKKWKKIVKL